jgi:hypothetical protein
MKTKVLLLLLVGLLATTGSTCIQDGFLVSVNLPIKVCIPINAGTNLIATGTQTVKLAELIDATYLENLKNARYYDIRVSTLGTFNGTVDLISNIDGVSFLQNKTQAWPWSDFAVPQSLLMSSDKIVVAPGGLVYLVGRLNAFKTDPTVAITLSARTTLAGQSSVPSGLSVCIEILAQVDAEVK